MPDLFATSEWTIRCVDLILVFMALEGAGLVLFRRATGRGIAPWSVLVNLIAGAGILLAMRAALSGWGAPAIAFSLALSFCAHLADVQQRWRS